MWAARFSTQHIPPYLVNLGLCLLACLEGSCGLQQKNMGGISLIVKGTHFRYTLNYLRDGAIELPDNEQLKKELLVEADYYGLDGLVEGLRVGFPDKPGLQPALPGRSFVAHQFDFAASTQCNISMTCCVCRRLHHTGCISGRDCTVQCQRPGKHAE